MKNTGKPRKTLKQFFQETQDDNEITWPYKPDRNMSYDESLIIDTDKDDELVDETSENVDFDVDDKLTSKQQRVVSRRKVEDILAEKAFKKVYGDIFDDF